MGEERAMDCYLSITNELDYAESRYADFVDDGDTESIDAVKWGAYVSLLASTLKVMKGIYGDVF